jgi:hypothetical protein
MLAISAAHDSLEGFPITHKHFVVREIIQHLKSHDKQGFPFLRGRQ